ncbi:unnamed protein product [Dibothriocephalus latus]|uniref:Uncharacterized protein n=1 Tax=Dibothriocephalus latus TaxID=60516 RepID=A0A3P7MC62_DIBLA|nr:unnamed protein product [Dibothriocephalus latus]
MVPSPDYSLVRRHSSGLQSLLNSPASAGQWQPPGCLSGPRHPLSGFSHCHGSRRSDRASSARNRNLPSA